MAPEGQSRELVEWLREDIKAIFLKIDALHVDMRAMEKTFLAHSPCKTLSDHLADHVENKRTWRGAAVQLIIAALVGATSALAVIWKKTGL